MLPNEFFEDTAIQNSHLLSKEETLERHLVKVTEYYQQHFSSEEIEIVAIV